MKWYWKIGGGHTHVRIFLNGAKCGDLCFTNEEFYGIRHSVSGITFIDENEPVNVMPQGYQSREDANEAYNRTDNTPK
jgi:hypothetical protein